MVPLLRSSVKWIPVPVYREAAVGDGGVIVLGAMEDSTSVKYKGWARLLPVLSNYQDDENPLVVFPFPLGLENHYVISSRNEADVSLPLPPLEPDGKTEAVPVEAVLKVLGNGKVSLERPYGWNARVTVDNVEIAADGKREINIASYGYNMISFGPWKYATEKWEGTFVDVKSKKRSTQIDRCHVCRQGGNVRVLACGHNICSECCRKIREQLDEGKGRPEPAPSPVLVNDDQQPALQLELPTFVAGSMPPHCASCRSQITGGSVIRSVVSVTITQMMKIFDDLESMDKHRPICDGCGNERGLFTSRDHHFCVQCQQMLCPPCLLQWHRSHQIKSRAARLRDMDEVNYMLHLAEKELTSMEAKTKKTLANIDVEPLSKDLRGEMKQNVEWMKEKLGQCRQQLKCIQQRKRALAHCWDETSQQMAAVLKGYLQECDDIARHIERLNEDDESSSDSSPSVPEKEPASATAPPANVKAPNSVPCKRSCDVI